MTMQTKIKRAIGLLCAVVFLVTGILSLSGSAATQEKTASEWEFSPEIYVELAEDYAEYLSACKDVPEANGEIVVDGGAFTAAENCERVEDYCENPGATVLTGETGFVEWTVDVPQDGLYNIEVEYYPTAGKGVTITRSLQIDGELPYSKARTLSFYRLWTNEIGEDGEAIQKDNAGNDLRPTQVETPAWQTTYLYDTTGYIAEPLQFHFTAGTHTVRLVSLQEPMAVRRIRLCNQPELPAYTRPQGEPATGENIKIQGEAAVLKSDATMVPVSDRSDSAIEPSHVSQMKLNCIGSTDWQQNGQMLTWSFHVDQPGLYKIAAKVLQNFTSGANSHRRIYIDGKVPFAELNAETFYFSNQWKMHVLGGDDPYVFYFDEGDHTISMEVTLGEVSGILNEAMGITTRLNEIYREILMITGSTADVNRDYQFDEAIPDTLEEMKVAAKELDDLYQLLVDRTGAAGQSGQLLERLSTQLKEMTANPDTIAAKFSAFQSNVSSMGSWISSTEAQPLTIDYLVVSPLDNELPRLKDNFWKSLWYHIGSFFASFTTDYNVMASDGSDAERETITVWVGSGLTGGRDQAQVLKMLINDSFTPSHDIDVQVQLVAANALLPAYMSGQGPDVVLSLPSADIMNYAFRNAALNLSQFEDVDEVLTRFHSSAAVPLSFEGDVYGLPETQTFPVLFYRKDILLDLGLQLPETWDDVIEMLPILQKQMLDFGLPTVTGATSGLTMPMYTSLLYQNQGKLYSEDGTKTLVNSSESETAFSFYTRLYTDYKTPQTIDFVTRFRMGSVPIGIADYQTFNQLSVFAPQLEGLWGFSLVPGTVQPDGSIDHSVAGTVVGSMILNNTEHPEAAWEFLKWWTDTEAQVTFGRQLESIMGTAARYPTANREALKQIPWTKEFYEVLNAQWKWVDGVPAIPGSYYTPRNIDFAFRGVVNSSEDVVESLEDASREINAEIVKKRKEFGLSD